MHKLTLSLFLMLSTALLLPGCESVVNPTFMPSGYANHQKEFKSPPGPPAPDIGYDYTSQANAEVLARWQEAIDDLLVQALANDLILPQVIYLQSDLKPGLFRNTFDSMLRDSLRASGYELSSNAETGTPVFFSAYEPGERVYSENDRPYNGALPPPHKDGAYMPPEQDMELVLGLVKDKVLTDAVIGLYQVPLYGFAPGKYIEAWEAPARPETSFIEEEVRAPYNN